VRLMPYPSGNLKAGGMTHFESPYLVNGCALSLDGAANLWRNGA
jgi:hypothetical protein